MTYAPNKKGTILIPTGGGKDSVHHLHAILTNKDKNNQHLLVNVTSIKEGIHHDTACVLKAGCHRFITKPSYVRYGLACGYHNAHLIKLAESKEWVPHDDFDDATFNLICDGVAKSRFTPRWFKTDFAAALRAGL